MDRSSKQLGETASGDAEFSRRNFQKYKKSVEVSVDNNTAAAILELLEDSEHFSAGAWQESFKDSAIKPSESRKAFALGRNGVSAGLMFTITVGQEKKVKKYFIVGFSSSSSGTCKTYVTVTNEKLRPKHGRDNARDNSYKRQITEEFIVEAIITTPEHGGKKHIKFSIADNNK